MKRREKLIRATNEWYKAQLENKPAINRKGVGPFVKGFIAQMLETAEIPDPDNWGETIELVGYTINDIHEPTLVQCISYCLQFYWRNRFDLEEIWAEDPNYTEEDVGRDFWTSKNGGEGFSRRGFEIVWDRLQSSAQFSFGESRVELREDGEIQLTWEEQ